MRYALLLLLLLLLTPTLRADVPEAARWTYYVSYTTASPDVQEYSYYATAFILWREGDPAYGAHALNCLAACLALETDAWLLFVLQCTAQALNATTHDDIVSHPERFTRQQLDELDYLLGLDEYTKAWARAKK